VRLAEAPSYGLPGVVFDPLSKGAQSFIEFAEEMVRRIHTLAVPGRMTDPRFAEELLARVEEAGLNASVPPQQRLVDGWLLRFSPGKAKRARSIQAISPGRLPLADKLALCHEVYAAAGLPMLVRITPFCAPAGLDAALERLGMRALDDTRVMLRDGLMAHPRRAAARRIRDAPLDLPGYAELVGDAARLERHAARGPCAAPAERAGAVLSARSHPRWRRSPPAANSRWRAASSGCTTCSPRPASARRGLARRLCAHLLAEAASRGARTAYLQVEGDNTPARAVYHRLGFADGIRPIHYRTDPRPGRGLKTEGLRRAPGCTFIDCTAAPLAPLPRLSRRAIRIACVSLPNTNRSTRLVSLQACTSKKPPPASKVCGSFSGITRMKRSPS
jgi:hypothetical protein